MVEMIDRYTYNTDIMTIQPFEHTTASHIDLRCLRAVVSIACLP